ncbi:ketopantoate reductase PanE/ApbA C terminal-domain-containing protein [Dendryphion nanum]|uniref:Ketopantoate reductase PanE/ApbA C terminal-domain-containing protein n=1 Tax=Dendryphion nanum TaxID=256645 RepID=A0A9P9CYB4_9PLEO|nr:ketopantoate reductase PanE/ApbA C terminal-domain-containing protein [Dendryphion nanum]
MKPESRGPQAKEGISADEENDDDYDNPEKPFSLTNPLFPAADFYRAQPVYDRRIHVLGLGSMGRFVAHSLRGIPDPPPVTLIVANQKIMHDWLESSQRLTLITDGASEKREGFDAEVAYPRPRFHGKEVPVQMDSPPRTGIESEFVDGQGSTKQVYEGESTEPISSLIVCTKTPFVLQFLSAVKHRLNKESVVLFLQNGMGTVDEVNREIFPDPETRPRYMIGVNTHGVTTSPGDSYTAIHAGFGTLALGLLPHEREGGSAPYSPTTKFNPASSVEPKHPANPHPDTPSPQSSTFEWLPSDRYLLRTLLRTPSLCAAAFSPPDLLQHQLERLAVSSTIQPLSVMLDARNGGILYNFHLTRVMRLLLAETSAVIRSLPELAYIPNVEQRFDAGRLETLVVHRAYTNRDNISSMLADVRSGEVTEVDYLNGWIVKKGEQMGMRCAMNYMMLHLVKGKSRMVQLELEEGVPFVGRRKGEEDIGIREGMTAGDEGEGKGKGAGGRKEETK